MEVTAAASAASNKKGIVPASDIEDEGPEITCNSYDLI
jgi:hypothetical protein